MNDDFTSILLAPRWRSDILVKGLLYCELEKAENLHGIYAYKAISKLKACIAYEDERARRNSQAALFSALETPTGVVLTWPFEPEEGAQRRIVKDYLEKNNELLRLLLKYEGKSIEFEPIPQIAFTRLG